MKGCIFGINQDFFANGIDSIVVKIIFDKQIRYNTGIFLLFTVCVCDVTALNQFYFGGVKETFGYALHHNLCIVFTVYRFAAGHTFGNDDMTDFA